MKKKEGCLKYRLKWGMMEKKEAGMYSWQIWSKDDSRHVQSNTCRMPRATFHVLRETYFLPRSMGHVSCDTNHVPRAAVYMSRAMCTCFYSLGESVEGAVLDVGHLVVVEGEAGQLAQAPECPLPKQFLLEAVQLPKQILWEGVHLPEEFLWATVQLPKQILW